MSTFIKEYDDIIDNPKIVGLPPETFRFWVFVRCVASRMHDRDGSLPPVAEIAFRCRCSVAEAEGHLAALVAVALVAKSGGKFAIARWDEFQGSARSAAARQKRYRQRKAAGESANPAQDDARYVTRDVTRCATVETRDVTRCAQREREKPPTEAPSSSFVELKTPTEPPSAAAPLPPAGGAAAAVAVADVREAVELVRRELGDAAANAIDVLDAEVDRAVAGRWDCFAAAVRRAARSTRTIRDVRSYLIQTTRQFAHGGIPPEPVAVEARASPEDDLTPSQRKRLARIREWQS